MERANENNHLYILHLRKMDKGGRKVFGRSLSKAPPRSANREEALGTFMLMVTVSGLHRGISQKIQISTSKTGEFPYHWAGRLAIFARMN